METLLTVFFVYGILKAPHTHMNPEILAKILKIAQKTGEKVIFVDSTSGAPFVLMDLTAYESLLDSQKPAQKADLDRPVNPPLTGSGSSGIIDPDLAFLKETKAVSQGEWGGDDNSEEDKFYMEPVE